MPVLVPNVWQTRPKTLMARTRDFFQQLTYLPRALHLIWQAAPRWTLAWLVLLLVQGLLPAGTVFLTGRLVDSLAAAMQVDGGWERLQPVLVPALLLVALLLLTELLQSATQWIGTAQAEYIQDHMSASIHEKSAEVDLAFYETPEYHDHLYRARADAGKRPLALLQSGGRLLQNGVTLLAMAAILVPYGLWLPVALLISTLPALYVALHFSRRQHDWWERTTPDQRRAQYYDLLLTHSASAPELRLFDLGLHFQSIFQAARLRLRTERLGLARERGLARLGAGLVALLISGAAMAWMVWRALQGRASLGDLAVFYQAFNRGQSLLRALLGNVGEIYSNGLFLGNLFAFLQLQPQVVSPTEPLPVPAAGPLGVRFSGVTFCYPGSERPALCDFDLELPAGKITAIVGPNGAGKSTLIKLLCRFYDPQAGAVELAGVDLRDLAIEELRRQITVLFQMPVTYQATAMQNIAIGDLAAGPGPAQVEAAARAAGAHEIIARLPRGYASLLGKWFAGGNEISIGEWQRVALARAFLRQAPLVLLDEPTSFMDAWAEADWLDRFRTLVQGRTALIVTHRFTTAIKADVIHVMDAGRIVESGTHAELLARGGRYAQSWCAQMQTGFAAQAEPLDDDIGADGRLPRVPHPSGVPLEEPRA
jgi:ATP-binding cassette subfamily B protein